MGKILLSTLLSLKTERTQSWVGREVGKIWEELAEWRENIQNIFYENFKVRTEKKKTLKKEQT